MISESVTENSAQVVDRAQQLIDDWQEANLPSQSAHLQKAAQQQQTVITLQHGVQLHNAQPSPVVPQSVPPCSGRLKWNIDVAFSEIF